MKPILEFFPCTPRQKQVKAIQYIEQAFNAGFKDVVIEAPTGSGKSMIASTACSWATQLKTADIGSGGYILVLQKVLQDQLAGDLTKLSAGGHRAAMIKSAVEYECRNFKKCSIGMAKHCQCLSAGSCAYRRAKSSFISAEVGVTNYAYFLAERQYVGDLKTRGILCLDEVQHLSQVVTRHIGLQVNKEALKDYAPTLDEEELLRLNTLLDFATWVHDKYVPAAKDRAAVLMSLAESDERAVQRAFEVDQHASQALNFSERVLNGSGQDGWVFWREDGKRNNVTLYARPLTACPYFEQLFGGFPLRVYLSAYPGAKGPFCRDLGLDPTKVAWLKLSSSFPVENRPVHMIPVGSMGRRSQEQTLPGVLKMIVKILDKEPERGLIHTHSYALSEIIVQHLSLTKHATRLVCPKTAEAREDALKQHADTPGSVLVSPSVYEGFDFKDDLARWGIITKCPYPSLGDKQVEAKSQQDPTWYAVETLKAFLQACGRICRSETDFGRMYVLDDDARRLLKEYKAYVPTWFLDAVVWH